MRIYSAASQEALRARGFLADWAGEGLLTPQQHQHLEKETVSGLCTTNIFLRLVLFLFTVVSVGAAAGLFYTVFLSRPSQQALGLPLLIFSAICYAAAEIAASRFRLYRYGIESRLVLYGEVTPYTYSDMNGYGVARPRPGEARTADDRSDPDQAEPEIGLVPIQMEGDGPLVLREKVHAASPMTIDQALLQMELVGHDFYLFHDRDCDRFSVVYRRRGYDYGVIRLVEE